MARRTLLSRLGTLLHEEFDGLKHRVTWVLRRKRTQQETGEARARRIAEWTQTREEILQHAHADLVAGSKPDATDLQRSYYLHLLSEAEHLGTAGSAEVMHTSPAGLESHISGWAAHFLPVDKFEEFYVQTVLVNMTHAPEAMMRAWRSVAQFRTFPRLVAHQTKCLSESYLGGIEESETREAALYHTRKTILSKVAQDLEKGRAASAAFAQGEANEYQDIANRRFYEFVDAEKQRAYAERDDKALRDHYLDEVKIHGWAAHFMASGDAQGSDAYKAFFARTMIANRQHECLAARRALTAARILPGFPPFEGQFDVCSLPRGL